MIVIFVVFFYFFMIRPGNKKAKEKQKLIDSIAVGSEIITVGGICGKVQKIKDEYLVLLLGDGKTTIVLNRSYVHSVLPKNTIDAIMSDAAVEAPKKSKAEQKKGSEPAKGAEQKKAPELNKADEQKKADAAASDK